MNCATKALTVLLVLVVLVPGISKSVALAASETVPTPKTALERLFASDHVQADWFAPAFLNQVSRAQVAELVKQLQGELGAFEGVERVGDQLVVTFAHNAVPAQVALDGQGRIIGLYFAPPRARVNNLIDATSQFEKLPGKVSLFVTAGENTLVAVDASTPLAVGSAFKLSVLAELDRKVRAGQLDWDDVVELKDEWKSLPGGVIQTWPTGSPLTVHTLAAQMISISDNTAADALIHLVGRETLELAAPRNRPFLTTREVFTLKSLENVDLLHRYQGSDSEERAALLTDIQSRPLPAPLQLPTRPYALDVEWFFTTRELCGLMDRVQRLPLTTINPGVADTSDWARVSFKGGSEGGVLNFTTWLTGRDGTNYCVSATWNDTAPLDEATFISLYGGLLDVLHELDSAER